jgi:flagellar L-ring protein FlgH
MNTISTKVISTNRRAILFMILLSLPVTGCVPKNVPVPSTTALQSYIAEAKVPSPADQRFEGSLWSNQGRRSDLFRDPKSRFVNDIVTIQVAESTSASSSAAAANAKESSLSAGVTAFSGLEKKVKELPNVVAGSTSGKYKASGTTSRDTSVTTYLSARVVDVLPNGYLVLDAVKDIRINNENQSLHVTGIARPEDISRSNVIQSSALAQMTLNVQGKGVVSQTLSPGWLYKILMGILPF